MGSSAAHHNGHQDKDLASRYSRKKSCESAAAIVSCGQGPGQQLTQQHLLPLVETLFCTTQKWLFWSGPNNCRPFYNRRLRLRDCLEDSSCRFHDESIKQVRFS